MFITVSVFGSRGKFQIYAVHKMGLCNIALDLLTAICPFMQELKKLA